MMPRKITQKKGETAEILINKLEAARRQIDAAIRMTFLNEDKLAIYTIVAAAYTILRDLKTKRSTNELSDIMLSGLLGMTKISLNQEENKNVALKLNYPSYRAIIKIIERENINTLDVLKKRIQLKVQDERNFWNNFNKSANFLKHADRDHADLLSLDTIDSDELILSASRSYVEIIQNLTPEMQIFGVYILPISLELPGWSTKLREDIDKLPPYLKRKFFLSEIRRLKADAKDARRPAKAILRGVAK